MSDVVYEKLAKHLDSLPAGFPATDSGVELRILKRLFTPQEAEIATSLSMIPEPVASIAERLGGNEAELSPQLEEMSKKGLIFRSGKGGQNSYSASQFVVGIWEYHVNDLDEGLIRDFNEYVPHLSDTWANQKTKQMRVVPVSESISAEMAITPYEKAEEIIRAQSKIVVAPCICRKEHEMVGKGCGKPQEVCLVFGGGAFYYEENGLGRSISQDEALEIVQMGADAGLVLQPGNSQKPMNICMCCGCCCQILSNLNKLDAPANAVSSNYYAEVDADECTACSACEERCQMNAIEMGDVAEIKLERCIGCGLCVAACEFDAVHLVEKKAEERVVPPGNIVETYVRIAQERGLL